MYIFKDFIVLFSEKKLCSQRLILSVRSSTSFHQIINPKKKHCTARSPGYLGLRRSQNYGF